MKVAGQIALFQFPLTNQITGKPRPCLLLRDLPGRHEDWWICMISSQLGQAIAGFDEIIGQQDDDFAGSGLLVPSVIRIGRIAVVQAEILRGSIGAIADIRLQRIRLRLAHWLSGA